MARNSGGFWRKPTEVCERFEEMRRRPRGIQGIRRDSEVGELGRKEREENGEWIESFVFG
jgi:hypothetical protein